MARQSYIIAFLPERLYIYKLDKKNEAGKMQMSWTNAVNNW